MGKRVLVSKGWLQSKITVQTLYWKKTNRWERKERVKDMEFSGVK